MKCQNCGADHQDGNFCVKCGSPLEYQNNNLQNIYSNNQSVMNKPPTSTLVLALLSYGLFFYLGLPATLLMIFSRDAFYMGDMDKFIRYNKYSKICSYIGLAIIALIAVVYILMIVGFVAMGSSYGA